MQVVRTEAERQPGERGRGWRAGGLVRTFETLAEGVASRRPAAELQVLDSRLHLQIAQYANNRFLAMTQTLLQEMLARSMETTLAIPGRPARSVRGHAGIVEALLAGDPARARAAARRHIHSSRRVALRRVASERDADLLRTHQRVAGPPDLPEK